MLLCVPSTALTNPRCHFQLTPLCSLLGLDSQCLGGRLDHFLESANEEQLHSRDQTASLALTTATTQEAGLPVLCELVMTGQPQQKGGGRASTSWQTGARGKGPRPWAVHTRSGHCRGAVAGSLVALLGIS